MAKPTPRLDDLLGLLEHDPTPSQPPSMHAFVRNPDNVVVNDEGRLLFNRNISGADSYKPFTQPKYDYRINGDSTLGPTKSGIMPVECKCDDILKHHAGLDMCDFCAKKFGFTRIDPPWKGQGQAIEAANRRARMDRMYWISDREAVFEGGVLLFPEGYFRPLPEIVKGGFTMHL